jgi:hypothetical protein
MALLEKLLQGGTALQPEVWEEHENQLRIFVPPNSLDRRSEEGRFEISFPRQTRFRYRLRSPRPRDPASFSPLKLAMPQRPRSLCRVPQRDTDKLRSNRRRSANQAKKPTVMANTPPARSSRRRVRVLIDWSDMACLKKIWPVTEQATENTTRKKKKSVTVSPPRAANLPTKKRRALPEKCRSGAATKFPLLKRATTQSPP